MEENLKKIIPEFTKKDLEFLFRQYFPELCNFARKYVRDLDTAKEIVHDVFVNLWDKRSTIDVSTVKSYLFTSVHNRCLNHIRNQKKFDTKPVENYAKTLVNNEPEDNTGQYELEEKINTVMQQLPEKCREIFVLSRFNNLKYKEIAEQLNISVKTVEAQMTKALKILRENLADYLKIIILILLG